MKITNIQEAKTHLSRLVELAASCETVVIGKAGTGRAAYGVGSPITSASRWWLAGAGRGGRVRHTNTLVIADRGFPSWPGLETVDLSLVDDVPTVLQVLAAIRENFVVGEVFIAEEFERENSAATRAEFNRALEGVRVSREPHVDFKKRVPQAIGLIRTGDTTQYANIIMVSA